MASGCKKCRTQFRNCGKTGRKKKKEKKTLAFLQKKGAHIQLAFKNSGGKASAAADGGEGKKEEE